MRREKSRGSRRLRQVGDRTYVTVDGQYAGSVSTGGKTPPANVADNVAVSPPLLHLPDRHGEPVSLEAALDVVRQKEGRLYDAAVEEVRQANQRLIHVDRPPFSMMTEEIGNVIALVHQYPSLCRRKDVYQLLDEAYAGRLTSRTENGSMETLTLMALFPTNDDGFLPHTDPPTFVADWLALRYSDFGERYGLSSNHTVNCRDDHYRLILSASTLSPDILHSTIRMCLPSEATARAAKQGNYNYYCWGIGLRNPVCTPEMMFSLYWDNPSALAWDCLAQEDAPAEIVLNACTSSWETIRQKAVEHPNCPEEGKIAAALRGDRF